MRTITHETFVSPTDLTRAEKSRDSHAVKTPSSSRTETLVLRWAAIGFCAAFWAGLAMLVF